MSVPPMDSMPPIRTSFTRGLAATWSSPVIVGGTLAWLLAEWLIIDRARISGSVRAARPRRRAGAAQHDHGPVRLDRDPRYRQGAPARVASPRLVHALWHSIVVGLAVEAIETGRCQPVGGHPGAAGVPGRPSRSTSFGVAVLFTSPIVAGSGAAGLSLILQLVILVLAVWVFAFAPVIAVTEGAQVPRLPGPRDAGRPAPRLGQPDVRGDLRRPVVRDLPRHHRRVGPRLGARREPPVHGVDLRRRHEPPPYGDRSARSRCGTWRSPTRFPTRPSARRRRATSARPRNALRPPVARIAAGRLRAPAPEGAEHARPRTATAGFPGPRTTDGLGPPAGRSGRRKKPTPGGLRACRHQAGASRGRRALRPPDQTVEPEDAALPVRGAFRHLHHRPREVPRGHRGDARVRPRSRPTPRNGPVHRHQEAGAGGRRGAREPGRACRS